jgi:hypothetical protein
MKRRDFLRSAGIVSAALAFPRAERLLAEDSAPQVSGGWRTFEITTRVDVLQPAGETRIWLPAALVRSTPYQRTLGNTFDAPGGAARLVQSDKADALGIFAATFPAGVPPVQPDSDEELRGESLLARTDAQSRPCRASPLLTGHQASAHRWHRETDRDRDYPRRGDRR